MTQVTPASIAYAATQVRFFTHFRITTIDNINQARFALSSSATFTRSDLTTDSERFYNSILQLCEDPDEHEEVNKLLVWWNRFVELDTVKMIADAVVTQASVPMLLICPKTNYKGERIG